MTTPIPIPPGVPFVGNVMSIDSEVPLISHNLLARQYGEIYGLNLLGRYHYDFLCSILNN